MNEKKKGNKPLVVGIVTAVAILAVVLVLLLTQCTSGEGSAPTVTSEPTQSTEQVMEQCDLYWNLDRAEYDGKSEAGMSSRTAEADGYYHVRFILDGEEVTLKVADRRLVNTIDTMDIMGLRFDEDGIVCDVLDLDELPLEKIGWEFFVQSTGGGLIKLNSSKTFNGMEVLLQTDDNTGIYDMSGASGPIGSKAEPTRMDRVYAFANQEGIATHVFLYSRPYFMREHEGECQHCKKTVTWKEWKNDSTLPTETGHYQLHTDIVVTSQQQIQEDQKVCLDLNGHLVTNKETTSNYYRIYGTFNAGTSLALMDTSEEKTGTIKAVGLGDKGLCVWVRYGEFHMYGGILDGSEGQSNYPGTTVAVEKTAYAYMYGGEIIGGLSKYLYDKETRTYSRGSAGAVYVVGKFVMHDGVIRDGRAEAVVTARNADGTPKTYQRGPGGNIFVNTGGVMEINGGTIKNGVAGTSGGNIFVNGGAELTINGGVISGGKAAGKGQNGGNLFVASKAVVTMNGGTIRGGISYNYAGNVYNNGKFTMNGGLITAGRCYDWATKTQKEDHSARNVYNVNATFGMYGGTVTGGFHCIDTDATKEDTRLVVSANAIIFDEDGGSHLTLSNTAAGGLCTVQIGNMYDRGKIGISAVQNVIFTAPTKEENADNFVSGIEGAEIIWTEEGLAIGRMQCVCGGKAVGVGDHKCEEVLFAPWASTSNLPTTSGNYFLLSDVSLKTHTEYSKAVDVNIDLNGNNITMNATENWHRVFRAYGTEDYKVTIGLTNSKTTGGTVKTDSTVDVGYGMMVWLTQKSHTFNLYDGILDASSLTGVNGGVAVKLANGTFNMYGGQIRGGYDNNTNTNSAVRGGGSVTVEKNGCFNMYGGTISDGGTVSNGGNFMLKGTLNVYGGSIVGGRADNVGGNIMSYAGSSLNVSDGEIYGGYKGPDEAKNYTSRFANVYSYGGNVTLSGGKVSGLAFYKGDANDPKLILSGDVVIDSYKGGIGLALSSAVVEIDDSEKAFTGSIAMTTTGYVTTQTKEQYKDNFTSLSEGINVLYHDNRILVGAYKYMCVCGGKAVGVGNHKCEELLWSAWTSSDSLPTSTGNYYLTDDVTLAGSANYNKEATVNIDLAGFDVTCTGGKDDRMFKVYKDGTDYTVTISVTDSVGGGEMKRTHTAETVGYGAIVWLSNASHTFNLYAGTLDGTDVKAGSGGAIVKMADGSKFNMYGGELLGGTAVDRDGGTVYINANAQFTLYAGAVSNGKTSQAGSTGRNGGNFYVAGTLNVKGGTISGGYAANQGGNIYVSGGGKLNVSAGSVENGYCGGVGGNVMTVKGSALTVSGGEIKGGYKWDGSTKNYNTAFANAYSFGGNVTLTGGTVESLAVYKDGTNVPAFNISGNAVISKNSANKGLTISGVFVTVDDSNGDFTGSVAVSSTGFITGETSSKYTANFKSATEGMNTLHYQGKIYIGPESKIMCICGGKAASVGDHICKDVLWTEWTSENSLPTTSGNYYLTKPVVLTGSVEYKTAAEVNIDLNGKTVTLASTDADARIFKIQGGSAGYKVTLGLTDSVGGGAVVRTHTGAENIKYGSVVWLADTNHTFNLYAGVLNGEAVVSSNGGAVVKVSNGKFNMYGGEIKGGKDNNTNTSSSVRGGGAVTIESAGTFNLYKGTVSGGESVSNGGNFMVKGVLIIKGGSVTGGNATENGGNIYIAEGGSVVVESGNVTAGTATKEGGNIYIAKGGELTVSGGNITEGYATTNGGNVCINGGTMTVSAGDVSNGHVGGNGGNIMAWKDSSLNVSGGSVAGGYKLSGTTKNYTTRFANIYSYGGNVTLSGGTVKGLAFYKGEATAPKLILSGDVKIEPYNGGIGLALSSATATIDDSQVAFTASIAVSTTGYITEANSKDYTKNFTSLTANTNVLNVNGQIYIGTETKAMCVCGGKAASAGDHTCKDVLWTAWTSENSLPTTSGNYYLTKPVVLTGSVEYKTAAEVNIDLNGKNVTLASTNADARIFKIQGGSAGYKVTLGLTDSVGGGAVVRTHTGAATIKYGSIVWLADTNHTFNLYSGVLNGEAVVSSNGGAVVKVSNGKFNMYGGEIKGGKDNNTNTSSSVRGGGAVTIESAGTFNLYKGTVSGGESVSNGGNFMVNGTLNIKGGSVTGGYAASQGGNIYVSGTGTLNISGGLVENGYAGSVGGNIQIWNSGKLNISGGEIKGGYKWDGSSKNYTTRFANVYSYGGSVTLSGGKVSGIAVYKGDVNTSGLTLSGNPTVDTYNGGIGLALSGIVSTVDDSKGSFSGTVAMTTTGQITTKTKESYLSCFTSLTSGKSPVYKADGCIWIE